ncbi:hypothetical protein [Actinomadura kijaniata]|uniref:hypothetical protein n=1 Tax=Actinomadura kijaniata TaxID=46161 RepID=UPI00082E3B01|nr:hypothetical protein [Actinomadura kijaniata]
MGPSEARFALFVRLVWEMRAVPATTVMVFPHNAEPVLGVRRRGCRRLVWRGVELEADRLELVARRIATEAAA